MTRRRDPFTTALDSLRTRAERGLFAPGRPVVIIDEARRLNLSTTPVREALAWLCGFGLIERAPAGGFVAPRLEPAILRDRLAFRLHCLSTAINGASQSHGVVPGDPNGAKPAQELADQMRRAVRGTGNATLIDAYERVCSQLRPVADAERVLFADLDLEATTLVGLFRKPACSGLREALSLYHQRRIEAAPLLIVEAEAGWPTHAEDL